MKRFLFYFIATVILGMFFTSCDKDDKSESSEITALEGKWAHNERTYNNDGYIDRTESFTFYGNKFALESSEIGVNSQGQSWGYGHKLTGSFICTEESTFTIKIEKFYSFNNDDKAFEWHEHDEGTIGKNFTFRYQFKYQIGESHSLGVTAPGEFSLGAGSFLGGEQVWYYAKE